jgi:hypothetical protein
MAKTDKPAAQPGSEYIVITPIDKAGEIYRPGSTITLTDDEAVHPLQVGAVRAKTAADQ